jgi:hypothetical protein
MLNWLRRRRLSPEARRQLLIIAARSEEAVIETHVKNALELINALGAEVDFERGIELYEEMMSLQPAVAAMIRNRVLARLEEPGGGTRFRGVFGEGGSRGGTPKRARR